MGGAGEDGGDIVSLGTRQILLAGLTTTDYP